MVKLTEILGYPLTLPQISQLASAKSPPFCFRRPGKNRLEVELGSFVDFCLKKAEDERAKSERDDEPTGGEREAIERRRAAEGDRKRRSQRHV